MKNIDKALHKRSRKNIPALSSVGVELRTREGKWIWNGHGLKLRKTVLGDQVIVDLPATIHTKGDYILMLRGVTGERNQGRAGTYYFRVVKE